LINPQWAALGSAEGCPLPGTESFTTIKVYFGAKSINRVKANATQPGEGWATVIDPFDNHVVSIGVLMVTSVAAGFDVRTQKIPNLLVFPAMLTALGYYTLTQGWQGLLFSLGGLATGIALLLLPYLMRGMGAGDAKLLGVVGACLGTQRTVVAFLFIAVVGCLCGLVVVVVHRRRFKGYFQQLRLTAQTFILTRRYVPVETAAAASTRPKVYYGIAIATGTLLYISLELSGFGSLL
jgi:prepilin peptidase CpaA